MRNLGMAAFRGRSGTRIRAIDYRTATDGWMDDGTSTVAAKL
jgi:hypothetical protein